MSWSVNKVGKAAAVAKAVADELAKSKCVEPEESIKNAAAAIVATALAAFPPDTAVHVEAAGSQSSPTYPANGIATNQLTLKITPLYGFVE